MILCTIVSREMKYLGTTLTKEMKNLHTENFKTLKKETEDGRPLMPIDWKDEYYRMAILPKVI